LASKYEKEDSAGQDNSGFKIFSDTTPAETLLASSEIPSDLGNSLFALQDNTTAQGQKAPWWLKPNTSRQRVVINMPWGVAGIRGTFWMIDITTAKETISLLIGNSIITAAQKAISITGDQIRLSPRTAHRPSSPAPLTPELKKLWAQVQEWVKERAQVRQQQSPE